jgi:hypothetical protein
MRDNSSRFHRTVRGYLDGSGHSVPGVICAMDACASEAVI